jgi:2-dehydropantoate 2-reductase
MHLGLDIVVVLAVSDQAIAGVAQKIKAAGFVGPIIHFSGASVVAGVTSAHPLMTFGTELYSLDDYKKIHFVLSGNHSLQEVLPGLPNPFSFLFSAQKAYYHTMCVMTANFPQMLWSKTFAEFKRLGIPDEALEHYLIQICKNFMIQKNQSITGPIARKDFETIHQNLKSLSTDPWLPVYQAFLEVHNPKKDFLSEESSL